MKNGTENLRIFPIIFILSLRCWCRSSTVRIGKRSLLEACNEHAWVISDPATSFRVDLHDLGLEDQVLLSHALIGASS
jgi:hypothetical protein